MHMTTKRLFDALKEMAEIDGYTEPGRAAQYLGESAATITNWKSRGISKQGILKANEILGVNPRWLATGEGEMLATASPATLGKPVRAHDEGEPLPDEYIQIPETEVRFAAGNGRTALFDEVLDSVPRTYRRDWFAKEGISPAHAHCFKVHGESMEPFLYDGDSVLVNLGETQILNGKVYALRYGDELRIKRVYRKLDGSLILHSDNPAFIPRDEEVPAQAVEQHISIIGRVRDKSGRGGL